MPRRQYTPAEKEAALSHLAENFGNIPLTAAQTGLPSRTLYTWRHESELQREKVSPPPSGSLGSTLLQRRNSSPPPSPEEEQEYTQLRRLLMQHIFRITHNLSDDPDTLHLRAVALTRLLDRVIKLQTLTRFEKNVEITVTRVPSRRPEDVRSGQFGHNNGTHLDNQEQER